MTMSKELQELNKAIQKFTEYFILKNFSSNYGEDELLLEEIDWNRVGDEVGDVLFVDDLFFNVHDMMDYEKYWYSTDEMIDHYWYALDQVKEQKTYTNIRNRKRMGNHLLSKKHKWI